MKVQIEESKYKDKMSSKVVLKLIPSVHEMQDKITVNKSQAILTDLFLSVSNFQSLRLSSFHLTLYHISQLFLVQEYYLLHIQF